MGFLLAVIIEAYEGHYLSHQHTVSDRCYIPPNRSNSSSSISELAASGSISVGLM